MAVVVVARWKGNLEEAMPRVKEVAALLKARGAVSARIGRCHSGPHAGQVFSAVVFPDWENFGKAHDALATDHAMRTAYAEALKLLELQERSVLVADEL